ncbi:hypothetical protein HWV62_23404 [Athelia sp. TMB]|nr:hypothetical protein HWV62_23404 [Athelia sp. TMB]
MTSTYSAAEAVPVAPYLTHIVTHHGQQTLIPPQNAGRARKPSAGASSIAKGKKPKSGKPKRERSNRTEEGDGELRFNLGAPAPKAKRKSMRATAAAAAGESSTRARQQQEESDSGAFGVDIEIPDYPPPTFEEAISTTVSPASTWVPQPTPSLASTWVPQPSLPSTPSITPVTHPSPIAEPSSGPGPLNPATRYLSILVEPSSSPQISPITPSTALPSPSPTTSASQSNVYLSSPMDPPSSSPDSDSDSLEIIAPSSDVAQRQWEEDRRNGLTLAARTKREWERHLATRTEFTLAQEMQQPQTAPTRSKSQAQLHSSAVTNIQASSSDSPPRRVPSTWRETLDEPVLTHTLSSPSLKRGRPQKPKPPLSPVRSLSPTGTIRPYHLHGPAASSLSLSLAHLRIPSAFGRSTTSVQTGGIETPTSSHRRRLFSRGKGKDKDRSFSDGDLEEEDEEPLDSWEVIPEKEVPVISPGHSELLDQSTNVTSSAASTPRVKPRLSLIPHLKADEEKSVQARGAKENAKVDPFPINVIPSTATSSPEVDEPQLPNSGPSSTPNPPFSGRPLIQPLPQIQAQSFARPRQRCGSVSTVTMRGRPVPPPPIRSSPDVRRPAPLPPTMRAASPYVPSSPSRPSPLSGAFSPARNHSPTPTLTPTVLHHSPSRIKRTPPPPPPPRGSSNAAKELHDRALNVPLPITPFEASPRSGWPSLLQDEHDGEIEREVESIYGSPHSCVCGAASSVTQSPTSSPQTVHTDISARVTRPPIDYIHPPLIPSKLALSIPAPVQPQISHFSRPSSPMSSIISTPITPPISPATSLSTLPASPRSHYAGRPLPLPPHPPMGARPMSPSFSMQTFSAPSSEPTTPTGYGNDSANGSYVPEAMLIDFGTEIDSDANIGDSASAIHGDANVHDNDRASWVSATSWGSDQESIYESAAGTYVPEMTTPPAAPAQPLFSEFTDLDLLVSTMQDGPSDGTDYDALLMVQEVVGPAIPFPDRAEPVSPTSPTTLLGTIEVERRRKTKDGHVRVKLSLLGAPVNKCGICLAQFKSTELGALGKNCQHW